MENINKEKNEVDIENYDNIKKIDDHLEKIEKEIKQQQIWIFFDEINTCNSMGLFSEIFCKHSYRGKPIPDR